MPAASSATAATSLACSAAASSSSPPPAPPLAGEPAPGESAAPPIATVITAMAASRPRPCSVGASTATRVRSSVPSVAACVLRAATLSAPRSLRRPFSSSSSFARRASCGVASVARCAFASHEATVVISQPTFSRFAFSFAAEASASACCLHKSGRVLCMPRKLQRLVRTSSEPWCSCPRTTLRPPPPPFSFRQPAMRLRDDSKAGDRILLSTTNRCLCRACGCFLLFGLRALPGHRVPQMKRVKQWSHSDTHYEAPVV